MTLDSWIFSLFDRAADSTAYKYIDCFNGGRFLSEEQCLELLLMGNTTPNNDSIFVKATPRQVAIIYAT